MADDYVVGAWVVLCGLKPEAKTLSVSGDSTGTLLDHPTDLNGQQAQLYEYHKGQQRWLAVTLAGVLVLVKPQNLRLAKINEVSLHDIILGPSSSTPLVQERIGGCLADVGYANVQTIVADWQKDMMLCAATGLQNHDCFSCLPRALEEGYLGKQGGAQVYWLGTNTGATVDDLEQKFHCLEQHFQALSAMLATVASHELGCTLSKKTKLMLRKSLQGDEASHPVEKVPETEIDSFLSMMYRKRIGFFHLLGPSECTLELISRLGEEEDNVQLTVTPGTTLLFLCEQYDYSFSSSGDSLVLQQWLLDASPEYLLSGTVTGNLDVLGKVAEGPAAPPGERMCCVGLGVRNPGKSDDMFSYYQTIRNAGCDGMLQIPHTRYDMDFYCDYTDREAANAKGQMYSRHQGHLEGIQYFDASFFQISNAEALGMDVEQRLTLETVWMALQDAGFNKAKLIREPRHVGVWIGISGSDWQWVPLPPGAAPGMGSSEAVIAGRCTFCLNLKGPSMIINTACSASLVSTHSCKLQMNFKPDALEAGIATGISINTTPHVFIGNCQTGALSFMGRSFSFNASADGFGRSEGTSACCYRLEGYTKECYGILAGSQNNHDGRSASLTAPNGPAQERCVRSVLTETGLDPPEIDSFECHGTGTSLGDPIELGAFKRLYSRKKRPIPVLATTSKTNLGHTEGGAGIAGFIKCLLMCMHTECAPNIHLRELNAHLDVDGFPCYFVSEGSTLTADSVYSGVSSFGVSGTNGHCLAYGKNVCSSRGAGQKNIMSLMRQRIVSSPPQVVQCGRGWEEWQSTGRPHNPTPGAMYQVEVTQEGGANWREVESPELRIPGGPFYIQGSFNNWQMDKMYPDENIYGLHVAEVEMGETGEETFQIVYDFNESMVFYPCEQQCKRKSAQMLGPHPAPSKKDAWLIQDHPETLYRIEFFVSGPAMHVTWIAVKV